MREILFRGKREDNGKWVIGFLSKTRGLDNKLHICIDYEEKGLMCSSIVIPETIGQYTGLTDKKGTKIFEGDILRTPYYTNEDRIIEWEDGRFSFKRISKNSIEATCCVQKMTQILKVIGNIHDNPELLKRR